MMKCWVRLLSLLLCLCLTLSVPLALGESSLNDESDDNPDVAEMTEEEAAMEEAVEKEKYIAVATVALKVRRGPGKDYSGCDSIAKDSFVYLLDLGAEWCKVRTARTEGYVQTKYLTDIREYNPDTQSTGDVSAAPTVEPSYADASDTNADGFHEGYKAYAVKSAILYKEKDDRGAHAGNVKMYEEVTVDYVDIENDWCYARYKGRYGYMRCSSLFKWDRIDPMAGPIPGCIVYPLMVFVKHTTEVRSYSDNGGKVLHTINPGGAICAEQPDELGRYKTPYWRKTGYITQDDIAYVLPVVPWEDAQSGDLISVMTTYYAVGVFSPNYQGRNWNIYLASAFFENTILQPNEQFNMNQHIGPYAKSTGYKSAPIASPTKATGYGGGTCQVNTTLYNTVIQVPIYVNWRKVHANVGAKYFLKGFDAAVGGGDTNMIFTNSLPYAIRINSFISDGVLTLAIFRV